MKVLLLFQAFRLIDSALKIVRLTEQSIDYLALQSLQLDSRKIIYVQLNLILYPERSLN